MYHLKGSPADPDRLFASQSTGWHGQVMQRSDDGGKTWETVGNEFTYDGVPGTHQWYDGTQHPWEFARVWHLEPSRTDPDTVFAGVEDAALFRSTDGGTSWQELSGLRDHETGSQWQPGAGGLCLHTIIIHPDDPQRMFVAISAAGAFRTEDGGETWQPINKGLRSRELPDEEREVGHCVHRIAMNPSRPDRLYMQKHWHVMRSDDGGDSWEKVSGNLPSDFGFPIAVDPADPDSAYVIPLIGAEDRTTPGGTVRVWETRDAGDSWQPRGDGLPEKDAYLTILREAFDTKGEGEGLELYFGATNGEVFGSADAGASWSQVGDHLPPIYSVRTA
jgi:photosystem II stability/assembly factor-like uncharacterized protein